VVTLRVKPAKAVRKAIREAGMRKLKVTLRVALPDGTVLKKTVRLERRWAHGPAAPARRGRRPTLR
jgi:hypothetical protein